VITAEQVHEAVPQKGAERALAVYIMNCGGDDAPANQKVAAMARALAEFEVWMDSLPVEEQRRLFSNRKALIRQVISTLFRQPPRPPLMVIK
jgi:hypothetical protein